MRLAILALLTLGLTPAAASLADDLDKDSRKWLDETRPLFLPDEEKTFRALKDKSDREEFRKIFWARRNPRGPAAAENAAKAEYETLRADVDRRFKVAGRPGSATDCARVLLLLGEPNEVKREPSATPSFRLPETWTYKDRPGFAFSGGQIQVPFDAQCQLAAGSRFLEQLNRPAEARIVSPNINYRVTADGHLVKLADQLPKPSPVQTLLKEGRQDFPLAAQPKLLMRGKDGASYLGGLVRLEAAGLTVREDVGRRRVPLVVAAQALDEAGAVIASSEQETLAELGADGVALGSYGLTLKPGKYTLKVGALDLKTQKGSTAVAPVEVPDFGAGGIVIADLLLLSDVRENVPPDPKDPLAAFFLGTMQLVPRFGNTFAKSETLQVVAFIYNPEPDPATGKPQCATRFQVLRDGKPVTSPSEEQVFDGPIGTPGIGPVPLTRFAPGNYVVQLKVTDRVAKKDYLKEASFEVLP